MFKPDATPSENESEPRPQRIVIVKYPDKYSSSGYRHEASVEGENCESMPVTFAETEEEALDQLYKSELGLKDLNLQIISRS